MDDSTLLDTEGTSNGEIKLREPNAAVKITRSCRINLERDEMFAQYATPLSKFKSEKQLCSAEKINMLHIKD